MRKLSLSLLLIAIIVVITGCGKVTPSTPNIQTTKKFQFTHAKLNLSQLVKTKIVYHTQEELESILNEKLTKLLNDNKLLSKNSKMNTLIINADYERRFVGDETALSTDSLAYPNYVYTIEIKDGDTSIYTIKKDKLKFKGDFAMNLQIIAGTLRDKKYELEFVEALANVIFDDINDLN